MHVRHQHRTTGWILLLGLLLAGSAACRTTDARDDVQQPSAYAEAATLLETAREALAVQDHGAVHRALERASALIGQTDELATLQAALSRQQAAQHADADDPHAAFLAWQRAANAEPLPGRRFDDLMSAIDAGERWGAPATELATLAERATDISMASWDAHLKAAAFWEDAKRIDLALPHLEWLHKVRPDDPSIAVRLADKLARGGALNRAIATLSKLLDVHSTYVPLRLKLIALYEDARRFEDAQSAFISLTDTFPEHAGILLRYASFLERRGESAQANLIRERARSLLPGIDRRDMRRLR